MDARGHLNVQALGRRPVEGGFEADKRPLWIAHVRHQNAILPAKAAEHLSGAFFTWGGKEHESHVSISR